MYSLWITCCEHLESPSLMENLDWNSRYRSLANQAHILAEHFAQCMKYIKISSFTIIVIIIIIIIIIIIVIIIIIIVD